MKITLVLFTILWCLPIFSQQEDAWVFLKDKPNKATFLANPLTMLSQRSLDRRTRQNIALDEKDVPVDINYYNQLVNDENITVLAKSKWLNAVHVQATQNNLTNLITVFSFIDHIEFANKNISVVSRITSKVESNHYNKLANIATDFNYGSAANQIEMLKGDYLHQEGFTGEGMQIAVIDAGFPNVNTLNAFQRLRDNNQILGGYDFVNRSETYFTGNSHGTHVLSDIGGYIEDQFVGTAPNASFYLFISEDVSQEAPIEESLWVEAAERADSLGVDVINTSLGYTTFDNANYNYTYADMNGNTTFISRGAEIGASRGMILVNAAGNSGNSSWRYIGAPADAVSVFSVGAVNASGIVASFSSRGPTSDGRVKPDVMAQGQSAYVVNYQSGVPTTTNGTSFSSPILAGVIACFWQAFPELTSQEIMDAIRNSSSNSNSPNGDYGYGIPNFQLAREVLSTQNTELNELPIIVYPNPVKNSIYFNFKEGDSSDYKMNIYSVLGQKMYQNNLLTSKELDVSSLKSGIYFLQIKKGEKQKIIKLVKE